ncbi:hypothetical protein [Brevibacillus sp. DP1.3A]|nr:hypothetical protein [Brevibacillus sp. DP1.3A]MED1913879.1 hypothetical protein [Bacillus thuringiensis]
MKKWILSLCMLTAFITLPVLVEQPAKQTTSIIQYGWPEPW